uniref:SV2 related protein n=1 Tax=Pavo cristatus TaxID=9049 RepID=A0A8C9EXW0_PAVCR
MEDDLFQLRQLPKGVRFCTQVAFFPDTFMVEDAVEAIGFGKFQWKLSVITGLAWMADAMEMMILSILAPQLHCEWRLPSWQVALLTSVVFVGMMSSSTLWGNISDQYGRKTGLKISVLWTLYYGILSGFAPIYSWILVLRGLVGFGIGGVPQEFHLANEFFTWIPALLWLFQPEEPRVQDELVHHTVYCYPLPLYILQSGTCEHPDSLTYICFQQEDRGKMRDLFTPHFRWTTLLLWFIWFSNAFSYYGLVLLTTEFFQAGDVCSTINLSPPTGVLVTLWIIDRIGRKKTMALSFFVFSFCSLLLFLCVGRNVLTVLLFIARAFISGGFQAAYVYTPEVYPTATRALGLGTCSGMARVGALITPFIAQVMLESSVYLTLAVYSGCCLLAAVASFFLPIETKGRGLQESSHREWGQEMVGRGSHSPGVTRSNSGSQE